VGKVHRRLGIATPDTGCAARTSTTITTARMTTTAAALLTAGSHALRAFLERLNGIMVPSFIQMFLGFLVRPKSRSRLMSNVIYDSQSSYRYWQEIKVYAGNYVIDYHSENVTTVKLDFANVVIQAVFNQLVQLGSNGQRSMNRTRASTTFTTQTQQQTISPP
jgi:hypothetical protein